MNAKEFLERDLKDSQGLSFACWKYGLSDAIIELMEEYANHKLASDGVLAGVSNSETWLCMAAGKNKERCKNQCVFCSDF